MYAPTAKPRILLACRESPAHPVLLALVLALVLTLVLALVLAPTPLVLTLTRVLVLTRGPARRSSGRLRTRCSTAW